MIKGLNGGRALFSLALILLTSGIPAYAGGTLFGHGSSDEILTYVVSNGSETVTDITSNHRILGYTVTGTANAVVGLYNSGVMFTEGGCLANDMQDVWFPFPVDMDSTLIVQVNASTTIVTIFYE